mmetsp:Transcript_22783/g.59345  ORF Transcript_22783/g.59345 Transcript_22783/m.59345 type:complete len:332 (+) Transcript_22783:302-1297(+)
MGTTMSSEDGYAQPAGGPPLELIKTRPVVVVGSMAADLVLSVDRLPRPGETIAATNCERFPGGKGANQAATAARLGAPTFFIGQFGSDANAELMRTALLEAGVDVSLSRTVEGDTGHGTIMLQPSGENSIIIVPGANRAPWVITDEIKQCIKEAGILLLQREIPEEVNVEVASLAHRAGVPVVLDIGGEEGPIGDELLRYITVISPNETELQRITGLPTESDAELEAAAQSLLVRGVEAVLVKLGAAGSMLLRPAGLAPVHQSAVPVQTVLDTTGAGDCYTASWAVASLANRSSDESMRFASAAAAICIQRKGAMTSLPSLEEVEYLLKRE